MRRGLGRDIRVPLLFSFLTLLFIGITRADPLILDIEVAPELSVGSQASGFTLVFSGYREGSESTSEVALYDVRANNMAGGRLTGALTARLSEPFENMDVEASVQDYQNSGGSELSTLRASKADFQTVGTESVSLADKEPGQGVWDLCLEGRVAVAWRARLKRNAPAGTQSRILFVTLKDA